MSPAHLAAWLLSLGLLLSPVVTLAQASGTRSTEAGDRSRDVASKHFRRAVELFQETAYSAALVEFERAYETLPDYRLHYNIAQTKRLLQDYVGATQSYQRYLSDGGAAIPDARRTEVNEQLAQLRERVARLAITASEDSVRIFVDDKLVGITPMTEPIDVNVGQHKVVARSDAGVETTKMIDVAGGDILPVYLPVQQSTAGAGAASADAASKDRTGARRYALAAMGLGGGMLVGALAAGITSAVERNNFDEAKADNKLHAAQNHKQRAERAGLATDILGATGLAVGLSGVITWFVVKPDDDQRPQAGLRSLEVGVGPTSMGLRGTF